MQNDGYGLRRITLLGCEYTGEWLWATSWTGLTLLLGEPKVPCKCLVDWTPWCRPTAARGRSRT